MESLLADCYIQSNRSMCVQMLLLLGLNDNSELRVDRATVIVVCSSCAARAIDNVTLIKVGFSRDVKVCDMCRLRPTVIHAYNSQQYAILDRLQQLVCRRCAKTSQSTFKH